jgi:hypothetical protein
MTVIELEKLLKGIKNRKLGVMAIGFRDADSIVEFLPIVRIREERDGVYIDAQDDAKEGGAS